MLDINGILDLLEKGGSFCLVTVIDSDNPDAPIGRKVIVFPDGTVEGEAGTSSWEAALHALARQALSENKKRTIKVEGSITAFFDIFSTDMKLLICGGGHIALPLARFAIEVGFKVTVLDDRSDFAHPSRFPGCDVIAKDFESALSDMSLGPSTYVVVITRGHEHDVECLAEILPKKTGYVGLIGSRRRVGFVLDLLNKKGMPRNRLDEVFTPIGLPLGSESPEEIALSIAAELVCVRRKGALQARALRGAVGGMK